MAPACPIRLPGGDARPAMNDTTGFDDAAINGAASSSLRPPISPMSTMASVPGSASKAAKASAVDVPETGSPPMPRNADWPRPARVSSTAARVPSDPLREMTPTRPGVKMRGSKAGMNPTKVWPG